MTLQSTHIPGWGWTAVDADGFDRARSPIGMGMTHDEAVRDLLRQTARESGAIGDALEAMLALNAEPVEVGA